jgi:sporulation protein YlmC with PRC-barrel domain
MVLPVPEPRSGMRLDLGAAVECSDGPYGELADVVIDPVTRRLTHIVVQPHHRHDLARLVPIERASGGESGGAGIVLDYSIEDLQKLEPLQRSAFLRLGEVPVEDPDWEVGIEDILALPYYQSLAPGAVGPGAPEAGFDDHVTEVYDRVPKNEVEIRRESAVISSDGHGLGHVDGLLLGDDGAITHLVLEHGHLWGKRELTIPVSAVAGIVNDEVTLSLTKDEVGELKSVPVHRWS